MPRLAANLTVMVTDGTSSIASPRPPTPVSAPSNISSPSLVARAEGSPTRSGGAAARRRCSDCRPAKGVRAGLSRPKSRDPKSAAPASNAGAPGATHALGT